MDKLNQIASEIQEIKEKTGVTFRHLAALLGVTEQTVRNWCFGVSEPPASKMDIIRQLK